MPTSTGRAEVRPASRRPSNWRSGCLVSRLSGMANYGMMVLFSASRESRRCRSRLLLLRAKREWTGHIDACAG